MERLWRDVRLAARGMVRKPAVTALALLSLALAIGFSTAGFSVLDAVLLRDAPFRDPNSLASIYVMTRDQRPDQLSWIEYQALSAQAHSFTDVIAEDRQGPVVKLPDRDDFPITGEVSDNYFDALGVRAARGDVFHAGQGRDQNVVISDHYWRAALGSDPAIVGRALTVGRAQLQIVGVLAPGFQGTQRGIRVDLFVPVQTASGALQSVNLADPRSTDFELLARLRPGVTLDQARSEADAILRQVEKEGRAPGQERHARFEAFQEQQLPVKILYLSTLLLLVIVAAANVANLRLVDNESRRRETGIKLALGAGRGEVARTHLAETFLLSVAGTALGLLVTAWLIRLAPALLYAGRRYLDYGIRLDARTFAFSSISLLLVMSMSALIPLRDAWKQQVMPGLTGTRTTKSSRWLTGLVVAQMAVVTGITCSAALVWRSFENVSAIRPAMDPERKLLMMAGYWENTRDTAATRVEMLASRLSSLPGVERVAWARRALLSGSGGGAIVKIAMPSQPEFSLRFNQVSPNYFRTTGAHVLVGRAFNQSDGPDATAVMMVNALFVHRFFQHREPIGEWVNVNGKVRQIVGIVEDGPTSHLREPLAPYLYFPFAQMPVDGVTIFVESSRDPGLLTDAARNAIRSADPSFTIYDTTTMAQHMRVARSEEIMASALTGGLASLGLLLAAAGLFGVSLFAVMKRTPEFGVKMALGATPARLVGQVLREALKRVAIAVPLGWALAYMARHGLEKILYGVAPDDPWTLISAGAGVALIGCCAALYPAIRAARVDPMTALRHE
jgi:putative ABC transport system permease protein